MTQQMPRDMYLPALVLASLLVAAGAGAQQTPAPGAGVVVDYANSRLTLRITQPTDLHAALEALCQRTKTRCDLAPELVQTKVEPTTISGTWKEVVATLLEGESVNYANLGPGPSGRLVVQTRRAAPPATPTKLDEREGKVAQQRRDSESADARDQEERREKENQAATPTPLSSPSEEEDRSEFRVGGGAAGERGGSQSSEPGMSSQEHQAREAAVWGIITGRTPTQTGPTAPPGMVALPFPDANGNPILVPATGQGMTAGPFPGPNGQPLPITPGVPGQPISNPFGIPSQPHP